MVIVLGASLIGCAKPAPAPAPTPAPAAEPIKIKTARFVSATSPEVHFGLQLAERVEEMSKGELVIEWLGGPEVIKGRDQAEAVRKGAVDMAIVASGYYRDLVPRAQGVNISEYTPLEQRETGYYDFLLEGHKKVNLFYVGRGVHNTKTMIYTVNKIERPQELDGVFMRSLGSYLAFTNSLGAVPIALPHPDTYSALERGVIEAVIGPIGNIATYKQYEVLNYWIDYGFYTGSSTVIIMNLDTWNGLPKHLQDIVIEAQKEGEAEMPEWFAASDKKLIDTYMVGEGKMKPITFSADDAKWYLNLAKEGILSQVKKAVSESDFAQIKKFVSK